MKILGIETSCDETAVSLLECEGTIDTARFTVLGDALNSQAALHAHYGGVYPNLAKREHAKSIVPLLAKALGRARASTSGEIVPLTDAKQEHVEKILEREPALCHELIEFARLYPKPDIDAIAVTEGPGLAPALWVGVNFAEALGTIWDTPVFGINHMEGHIASSLAQAKDDGRYELSDVDFPVLALLISGGHTELVLAKKWGEYTIIGRTRDDAVGEAFDKVARTLGLPYPGGPHLSKLADEARQRDEKADISFPRPMIDADNCDFSFSGLKTAVLYAMRNADVSNKDRKTLAREFEDAVADVLVKKSKKALQDTEAMTFVIGGGVAANAHVRKALADMVKQQFSDIDLRLPEVKITGDNAIMIAIAGYLRILGGAKRAGALRANANLRLEV